MVEVVPAILTNDISDFRKKYAELFALTQFFSKLHIDFADGEFVNNKTISPKDLSFIQKSPLTLYAHFMSFEPIQYFSDVKAAGFKWVIVHYEAFNNESDILAALESAKKLGLRSGLAINPTTPLHKTAKLIQKFDLIQLMAIEPGFQGREFIPETIGKIKELRNLTRNGIISVDGGIKVGVAKKCAKAGADLLVAGSAILSAEGGTTSGGKSQNEEFAVESLIIDANS